MTKVLDILEQFLNIHGYRYLRLDGATKIEQRQILTDRFNNDPRILVFILSSRSGGLGINLTGADTVIFYDLDWNPAMDKQCQDRCHRIGQTRDVHIYRLVSEHTIEANILRKANQKRMLDDVVIQEGEFTTDYFNKMSVRDVLGDEAGLLDGDAAASAAMDRLLGGPDPGSDVGRVLEQAEDQEDVAAAKVAQQEIFQTDAADFDEKAGTAAVTPKTQGTATPMEDLPTSGTGATPVPDEVTGVGKQMEIDEDEVNAWGAPIASTDDYMLSFMTAQLKDTPLELPKDKNKSKRGKDHRHRSHRAR
jgi:helicase SWR1